MSDQPLPDIPLPSGWAKNVKSAVLHVVSLAQVAIIDALGLAAKGSDGPLPGSLPPASTESLSQYRPLPRNCKQTAHQTSPISRHSADTTSLYRGLILQPEANSKWTPKTNTFQFTGNVLGVGCSVLDWSATCQPAMVSRDKSDSEKEMAMIKRRSFLFSSCPPCWWWRRSAPPPAARRLTGR